MNRHLKRLLALSLCLVLLAGFVPAVSPADSAEAAMYSSYTTIAKVTTQGGCNAMQGMDVDGTYIYCAKIDSSTETTCSIARVHKTSGDIVYLKNSATGTNYFSQLAHANDLAVCTVNNVKTMFVGTGGKGIGDYSLVRFSFNGTTLTEVGHYNMKYNGAEKYIAGVKVVATSTTEITLVLKSGNYVYAAKIPYSSTGGDIAMDYLGKLDFSAVNFGGTVKDISNFVVQGFGYKDNKLFVPMTANYQTSTSHISTIVCFDIDGMKGGNLKPDPNMSVWIEDTTYPDLFEIESCAICPTDGKLYFGTNCRVTSSDGNHDGVHVLNGFVYNPAMGDLTTGQNYHFRASAGKLKSVTTGAAVFNSVLQHLGQMTSGNKITGARWSMDMPIILKHNEPWILTWEASNWTSHSLFLSTYDTSGYAGNRYLYRRSGSGLIALGYQGDGNYHNYGVNLSSHGIDDTVSHKYQLKNVVNADGTNMVYLWVDGTKLGAMNNYYIGSASQSKTDNWVSGKDFSFSYIGTPQHPVSCTLQSLQVWTQGNINAFDEPSIFRWETQSDKMTPVSQFGYTANPVTVLGGSCSGGNYAGYYGRLEQPVVLMHDKPWVMEWKTASWTGNTMLFSSGDTALKLNASYLYRSADIVALGYCDGAKCHSYGIKLADHGIDPTAGHTYRMTNRLNADGTNMVYLSVDGQELGPMNRYYLGSEYQNTDTNWVSGKDYTFPYMGNYHYNLNQPYEYIQVWENGIPADAPTEKYRWEGVGSSFKNITSDVFTANTANRVVGSISGGVFNEATYRLNTPVVLRHDQPWSVSWQSSGNWTGSAGGAFLLSASQKTSEINAPYLYRRKDSEMIGFGIYTGSKHEQYGIKLSDHGIDGTVSHSYTLTNRVNDDGTNMVYLSVDGQELGAMNNYFVGGTAKGTTSNWISGKDFTFPYIGTPRFPLSNVTINYLEINEGCAHSYTAAVTAPTCTEGGYTTYTCSLCGDSYQADPTPVAEHSYESTVVPPTCTEAGYTLHTCSVCGDSYTDTTVASGGHKYVTSTTAPTCTESGEIVTTCSQCGLTHTETTAPKGHTYTTKTVAATCTEDGSTTYTCTDCGDSYSQTIPATGHSYSGGSCANCGAVDPAYDTNVDYYLFGYINGANYACEEDYENMGQYKFTEGKLTVTFTADSYVAVKTTGNACWFMTDGWQGNETTSVTLYDTNTLFSADKLFVPGGVEVTFTLVNNGNGSLTLSYAPAAQLTQPTVTLKYPTLTFEDVILMNVYFAASDLEDVTEMGLITYTENVTEWNVDNANAVIPGYAWSEADGLYYATTKGIAAKDLGDEIYFAVYAKLADGTYYYSRLVPYSPRTYAYSSLATGSASMKPIVVAMLNYGAAAQNYFNYKTDHLVNADLTAEQAALVEGYRTDMITAVASPDAAKQGALALNGGYARRYPTVSFEGAFCINYYATPSATPNDGITMYYWAQEDYEKAEVLTLDNATDAIPMTGEGVGEYHAAVEGIAAKDLSRGVYVCFVYSDGSTTYYSGVLAYSIGTYCAAQAAGTGTTAALAQATAVYGYYANELFNK